MWWILVVIVLAVVAWMLLRSNTASRRERDAPQDRRR